MDRERVLADQTVIVEGDKIVAMGSRLAVPAHAQVIDGHQTAYLSPGLADIHRTKGGDPFGIVAPGYRADLILSENNPLAALATLRSPLGVMIKGQWRDAAALKAITDKIRQSYREACAMTQEGMRSDCPG